MAEVLDRYFYVKIFSPFEIYYEGEATALTAQNSVGVFDVLVDHANFVSLLLPGKVSVLTRFGKREIELSRGILKVANNHVVLFANV